MLLALSACGGEFFAAAAGDGGRDVDQVEAAAGDAGDELASADAPFREATSPEAGNTPDSGRRSDSSTPAGDASADVVDELEADVDAGDVADAGLCCSVTGAPACTGGCSFPCTLCVAGGACSHVYQGVNYAGQVTACP